MSFGGIGPKAPRIRQFWTKL